MVRNQLLRIIRTMRIDTFHREYTEAQTQMHAPELQRSRHATRRMGVLTGMRMIVVPS
jgi:hypothetical protein